MADLKTVEVLGDVDRRKFLNRAMLGALSIFSVALGGGSIGMLWPDRRAGAFGGKIDAGSLKDVYYRLDRLNEGAPLYHQKGKFYLVRYSGDQTEWYASRGVLSHGLMAIYQKCSHLGCRTPYCPSSDLFECPCHCARFNKAGERQGRRAAPREPGPRGTLAVRDRRRRRPRHRRHELTDRAAADGVRLPAHRAGQLLRVT